MSSAGFGFQGWRAFGSFGFLVLSWFGACRSFDAEHRRSSAEAGAAGDGAASGGTSSAANDNQSGGAQAAQDDGRGSSLAAGDAGLHSAGSTNEPGSAAIGGSDGDAPLDGGEGGEPGIRILGADAPGVPLDPERFETYGFGYYGQYQGAGMFCPRDDAIPYCNTFGQAGSRPYVIGSPAACGTHAQATEFAGFGVVYAGTWHNSLGDFYWTWGLDEKYDGTEGADPWPVVWNGVLVGFELVQDGEDARGKFTVDWKQRWWRSSVGVVELDFSPEGLVADVPAYPVIGRWRREYGARLGLYQGGTFYLDWDGDNAWNSEKDRALDFATPGEYPVAADFWPGGGDEVGTYKDGTWYVDANQNGTWDDLVGGDITASWGEVGSLPVIARDGWLRHCD